MDCEASHYSYDGSLGADLQVHRVASFRSRNATSLSYCPVWHIHACHYWCIMYLRARGHCRPIHNLQHHSLSVDVLPSPVGISPIHSVSYAVTCRASFPPGYTRSITRVPLVKISRVAELSLLHRIKIGRLFIDETGSETRRGRDASLGSHVSSSPPCAELNIKREVFRVRLALFADIALPDWFHES